MVVVGLGYAWVAAGTTPFTLAADVATAVPLAIAMAIAIVVAVVVRRRRSPGEAESAPSGQGTLWPWWALMGVVAVVELVAYVAGLGTHRYAYPTISSLYDAASSVRAVKALLFFGWLALGWVIACQ